MESRFFFSFFFFLFFYSLHSSPPSHTQHNTTQHNTTQHNTTQQYKTKQNKTKQNNTKQHKTKNNTTKKTKLQDKEGSVWDIMGILPSLTSSILSSAKRRLRADMNVCFLSVLYLARRTDLALFFKRAFRLISFIFSGGYECVFLVCALFSQKDGFL